MRTEHTIVERTIPRTASGSRLLCSSSLFLYSLLNTNWR